MTFTKDGSSIIGLSELISFNSLNSEELSQLISEVKDLLDECDVNTLQEVDITLCPKSLVSD